MSILVKGVDMPTSCTGCGFVRLGWDDDFICTATRNKHGNPNYRAANWDGRPPYCPLVEVSDGTVTPRYCDRNICKTNELNGVGCDECVVAQNYNLEDDDSPCQNCEVGE